MASLYWVGDGGNWSDNTNHWSASSGGAPGAPLPTATDDVFWDTNSFTLGGQTVNLDTTAFGVNICHDFDATAVTNNPTMNFMVDSQATDFSGSFFTDSGHPLILNNSVSGAAVGFNGGGVLQFANFSGVTWTGNTGIGDFGINLWANGVQVSFTGSLGVNCPMLFTNDNCAMSFDPSGSYTTVSLILNNNVTISSTSSSPATITVTSLFNHTNGHILRVKDITAAGVIPFNVVDGGVNLGGNTNWKFNPDFYLQNTFFIGADTSGNVQTIDVGKNDNGAPIFFELETQEIDFLTIKSTSTTINDIPTATTATTGARAHLKKIADKIVVFTDFASNTQLEAKTDQKDYSPIRMSLDDRVNTGKNLDLEGHFFKFRWFGQSATTSPVFEGFYLEDITDLGMTYG